MRKKITEIERKNRYKNFLRSRKRKIEFSTRIKIIENLTKIYGFRCWYCGYRFKDNSEVNIDHKIAKSKGGNNRIGNFALSCNFCNLHKFDYSIEDFLRYIARLRSSDFECLIIKNYEKQLTPIEYDKLQKSFWD